jgi:hypothetical protein
MQRFLRKRSYNKWMRQLEIYRSIRMNVAGITKRGVEDEWVQDLPLNHE